MASVAIGGLQVNNPMALANSRPGPSNPAAAPTNNYRDPFVLDHANGGYGANPGTQMTTPAATPPVNTAVNAAAAQAASFKANQQQSINDSANTTVGQFGTNTFTNDAAQERSQADQNLATIMQSQQGINNTRTNAELNRQMSIQDLGNNIRSGLASTGVSLGNTNGLDSSAAEGAARAYNEYGAQNANDINGQANLALTQADQAQTGLEATKKQDVATLEKNKADAVTSVSNTLGLYLKQLDDTAQAEGLSPLNYQGLITTAVNHGQTALQSVEDQYNQALTGGVYSATSNDQAQQTANTDYQQGIQPVNQSSYTYNNAPITSLGNATTAAPTVNLPLYTKKTG